jgi:acetolactate synthase-1/2/3 large subunit
MNASELFIKSLENEGVKYIFGVAGEENLHLLEALRKSTQITYIPVRHEQAAGFMAATYGRLSGKAGVALSTLGPGATNFLTAAAYAKLGAMPMLMITGQKPIRDNKQGSFQIINVIEMFKPITEKATSIAYAHKIPAVIRESMRVAEEERPGPVLIELPKDVALDEVNDRKPIVFDQKVRRPIAEYKAISKAVEMIQAAKKPILLIGASANRKTTSKMLTEFIEHTKIPFVTTQMGKGIVDERSEYFIGTAALTANDYVHDAFNASDLIINVGHDVIEKSPFLMSQDDTRQVIHINYFATEVHDYYFPQLEVIGDIANAIWQLKEQIKLQDWDFSDFKTVRSQLDQNVYDKTKYDLESSEQSTIKPYHLIGIVRDIMGEADILALDNGMYKLWFARYYKAYHQNTILLDNALATMGAGLPSAIAAKLLYPEKRVVCVAGDGGFMMNSQELETAVRLKLDLVILLLNDNGLGMIKWEQAEKEYGNFGLEHGNPDFVKYAESYGAKGHRAQNNKSLKDLIESSLEMGGVHLIEVPIDYSENHTFTHPKGV